MSFTELETYFVELIMKYFLSINENSMDDNLQKLGYYIKEQSIYLSWATITGGRSYSSLENPFAKITYFRGVDAWNLFLITYDRNWKRCNNINYPELEGALSTLQADIKDLHRN